MENRTELHDKIQQVAAKIIDLNAGFAGNAKLNRLDTDLLKKYALDLYEHIVLLERSSSSTVHATSMEDVIPSLKPTIQPPVSEPSVKLDPPNTQPAKPPVAETTATPPAVEPLPVIEKHPEPKIETPPAAEKQPEPKVEPPAAETKPEPKPVPAAEKSRPVETSKETSLYERLQQPEQNDLAHKMQQTPIGDLKKAISINKKFEFINQLFKGDHEAYTKAIHYINGLGNVSEATTFFNQLKTQFEWDEENKLYVELADLIRRRFL
ncbi:MAG TPA: hypothetical protein VEC12_11255 [Bacteroidia bacterium]|nr:hypothetical protein [Bacteroidia bacterium]